MTPKNQFINLKNLYAQVAYKFLRCVINMRKNNNNSIISLFVENTIQIDNLKRNEFA